MIVPDSGLIAEIILFGEGFSQTRVSKQDDLVTHLLTYVLINTASRQEGFHAVLSGSSAAF